MGTGTQQRRAAPATLVLALTVSASAPAAVLAPPPASLQVRGFDVALPFRLRILIKDIHGPVAVMGMGLRDEKGRYTGDETLKCQREANHSLVMNPIGGLMRGAAEGLPPGDFWVCRSPHYQRVLTTPLRLYPQAGFVRVGDDFFRDGIEFVPRGSSLQLINDLDVEDYLAGLVNKEIRSDYPAEAVKAQVIAARSYALATAADRRRAGWTYDLVGSEADQVYQGTHREDARSFRFVRETAGEVLMHQEEVLKAFYHSSSGGFSEVPQNVWTGEGLERDRLAYRAQSDNWDEGLNNKWSVSLSPQMGLAWPGIGLIRQMRVIERTEGHRVRLVEIRGTDGVQQWSGPALREKLGPRWLKSTLFQVRWTGTAWQLDGAGWGHGVGLSQLGARRGARLGKRYQQILAHYYPFAHVQRLDLTGPHEDSSTLPAILRAEGLTPASAPRVVAAAALPRAAARKSSPPISAR